MTDEATAVTGARFGAFYYNVLDDKGESYTLYTLSGERGPIEGSSTSTPGRNSPGTFSTAMSPWPH